LSIIALSVFRGLMKTNARGASGEGFGGNLHSIEIWHYRNFWGLYDEKKGPLVIRHRHGSTGLVWEPLGAMYSLV